MLLVSAFFIGNFVMIGGANCCFTDPCKGHTKVCDDSGNRLTICNQIYNIRNDCILFWAKVDECCFVDACNGELLCEHGGSVIRDSCRNLYRTSKRNCNLEFDRSIR